MNNTKATLDWFLIQVSSEFGWDGLGGAGGGGEAEAGDHQAHPGHHRDEDDFLGVDDLDGVDDYQGFYGDG